MCPFRTYIYTQFSNDMNECAVCSLIFVIVLKIFLLGDAEFQIIPFNDVIS